MALYNYAMDKTEETINVGYVKETFASGLSGSFVFSVICRCRLHGSVAPFIPRIFPVDRNCNLA